MRTKIATFLAAACLLPILAGADESDGRKPIKESAIEVVSFNIRYLNRSEKGVNHWSKRKSVVTAALLDFDADIYGLQEALRPQLDHIAETVPGYTEFGIGRDDGKTRGEYSPILFRTERFVLDKDDCGTFWLSDTPEEIASKHWGNSIPRICTWARLTDKQTGDSLYVFNTHWDHQSQPARLGSAKLIAKRIAARKHNDEPVILLGDFNAARDNPAIQHLTNGAAPVTLLEAYKIAKPDAPKTTTFHGFRGGKNGRKIDHIFVASKASVKEAEILYFSKEDAYPSDHYPVRARLQFR